MEDNSEAAPMIMSMVADDEDPDHMIEENEEDR